MIVSLSTQLGDQVTEYVRLRHRASQVGAIQATMGELDKLRNFVLGWATIYPLVEGYFDDGQRLDLRARATYIHRRLQESKNAFGDEYNQHSLLDPLQTRCQQLIETTRSYWQRYAESKLGDLRERARIARQLPDMQPKLQTIETTVAQLEQLARKLPEKKSDIESFHDKIAQLDGALRLMQGINAEQTALLRKLDSGSASLVDISPELLAWCKEAKLAPLLKIQLTR